MYNSACKKTNSDTLRPQQQWLRANGTSNQLAPSSEDKL